MKYIWNAKYSGPTKCSGTLMGDPMVALLCMRETGVFTPDENQTRSPQGWAIGQLVTTTKGAKRVLKGKVIARIGGQWKWDGGYRCPGSRHFDFGSWSGREVVIEADKQATESVFAGQLTEHGWTVVDVETIADA